MASHLLTILVLCINSVGRFNASTGLTTKLKKRGHRVIYLVSERFQEKLTSMGFEVIVKSCNENANEIILGEKFAKNLLEKEIIGPASTLRKSEICVQHFFHGPEAIQWQIEICEDFAQAMQQCKPDLIIVDHLFLPPSIYYGDIPWIRYISTNPLIEIFDDKLPPGTSGK